MKSYLLECTFRFKVFFFKVLGGCVMLDWVGIIGAWLIDWALIIFD